MNRKTAEVLKTHWKPGTMLMPVPVVMVSCQADGFKPNIITVAWAGTICSDPPMLSISITPARHSFEIIKKSRDFIVNIPSVKEARATDYCGVISGRTNDKFADTGLTPATAKYVKAPIIAECPINIECQVHNIMPLGSHTMFTAYIKGVQVSSELINKDGRLAIEKAGLVAFAHGSYFQLGRILGTFGYSVRKAPQRRH